jgi:competence protein ComFC
VIQALEVLLDLLFPPKCVFCGALLQKGESGLCAGCQTTLPWLTGEAAEQKGEFFSLCVSPLRYQDKVRDSLRRYKFSGRRGYGRVYGTLLAQCVHDHLAGRYDLITWVPLSARRRRQRGYDQAFLLASAAAEALGEKAVATLRKARHNRAQSGLGEDATRRANVIAAYEVLDREAVRGRRVLLIDDIVTTGATLSECARTLLAAGAKEVVCAAAARAR